MKIIFSRLVDRGELRLEGIIVGHHDFILIINSADETWFTTEKRKLLAVFKKFVTDFER